VEEVISAVDNAVILEFEAESVLVFEEEEGDVRCENVAIDDSGSPEQ